MNREEDRGKKRGMNRQRKVEKEERERNKDMNIKIGK